MLEEFWHGDDNDRPLACYRQYSANLSETFSGRVKEATIFASHGTANKFRDSIICAR